MEEMWSYRLHSNAATGARAAQILFNDAADINH